MKLLIITSLVLTTITSFAQSFTVDLTQEVPKPSASPYGPGTSVSPQCGALTLDTQSFFLNGQPWIPVAGEFHYSRYARAEWRDELLKIKAGGINTVATYVFWIHHEEERGQFDWSGQRSLRDFLKLCQEIGLKVIVRMGPWDHGEVRNGGFPDWVQNSGTRTRTTDPAFLKLVEPFFREQARQMAGLLWKDGGPVIGVQMDNECWRPDYLLQLKKMARDVGVDVPIYTMTGWNGVPIPKEGLLPLFGAYSMGFWGGSLEEYRKSFVFSKFRDDGDMGAQFQNKKPSRSKSFEQFPYACAEIGGGMMSSYGRRIKIYPDDIGAMALVKLGSGNNMPGYYMYHGGTNPDGKLSWLNEERPNQLPFKDYDFQTAIGSAGQIREQYHLLRQQHLFLEDFGSALARMPVYFPDQQPSNLSDFTILRWAVRSDGEAGFLFFNNHQPDIPLPEHNGVRFSLKTKSGTVLIPKEPMTIPVASYGIWPVNLDCSGVKLVYATAQPLCRIKGEDGNPVYFFTTIKGIAPELVLRSDEKYVSAKSGQVTAGNGQVCVNRIQPGPAAAVTVTRAKGSTVTFVVLTPEQGKNLWRAPFAGHERAILSAATVLADGDRLRLQANDTGALSFAVFPPIPSVKIANDESAGSPEGIFNRFKPVMPKASVTPVVSVVKETPAGPAAATLKGMDEAPWKDAAIYKLDIPETAVNSRLILNLNYIGDAARLYLGDKLIDDHFYNGDPMPVALWRLPVDQWSTLRLKILPYSDALDSRLPDMAKRKIAAAKAASTLDEVTVTAIKQFDLEISPK